MKDLLKKMKLFQKVVIAIFCVFMSLMVFVVVIAYTHRSGITGLDMAKVQQMRYETTKKAPKADEETTMNFP